MAEEQATSSSEKPKKPPPSPEKVARNNRIVLAACSVFFVLAGLGLGAYAVNQYHDWHVRTTPPGGHTTATTVDEVDIGQNCTANGKTANCSTEYTLHFLVDGDYHTTPIRHHLHVGDTVHAFKGSDGKWYVTEDTGFGNSKYAWVIWAAFGGASIFLGLVCLRGWLRMRKKAV